MNEYPNLCPRCFEEGKHHKIHLFQYRGFMRFSEGQEPEQYPTTRQVSGPISGADHYWCGQCRTNFDLEMNVLSFDPDKLINDCGFTMMDSQPPEDVPDKPVGVPETPSDPELLP
jgi:hypothetical protein